MLYVHKQGVLVGVLILLLLSLPFFPLFWVMAMQYERASNALGGKLNIL